MNEPGRMPLALRLMDFNWHDAVVGVVSHVKAIAAGHETLGKPTPDNMADIADAIFWLEQLQAELITKYEL